MAENPRHKECNRFEITALLTFNNAIMLYYRY